MIIISVYDAGVITRVILLEDDPDVIKLVDYAINKDYGVHVAKVPIEEASKLHRNLDEHDRVHRLLVDASIL